MAWSVTVAEGLSNVVLPDGLRHRGGDVVSLSDEEYGQLSDAAIDSLLTSIENLSGGGGSGTVTSVNGVSPDTGGNIALAPADLAPPGSPAPSGYAPLLYGAIWNWPWRFWPDKYGMKLDGRVFEDAAVSGGSLSTLGSPEQAQFSGADVGRSVLGWTGSQWYAGTVTGYTSPEAVTISPAAPGAFSGMGCVIASDDSAAAAEWLAAAVAYAQAGAQEAELYMPPLISGWAGAATLGSGTGGGNAQMTLPTIVPGSALACSLVIRSDGKSAGPMHWNQTSHVLPGACIVNMRTDGSLDNSYGPTSVIGGPVYNYGGGGGNFSNCRVRIDGLTVSVPYITGATGQYAGVELYGMGQASVGDYTYLPLGVVPSGGAWPQFSDSASNYAYGLRMPANGNNALSEIDQYTCYAAQVALIASEHTRIASMRTIYGVYGLLPMSYSGGESHDLAIQKWTCENVSYPVGSVSSGFFELAASIGIHVDLLNLENYSRVVSDGAGRLFGDVNFNIIDSPGSYISSPLYDSGSGMGVRLRRLDVLPGLVASPEAAPGSGSAWLNGYYRDAEVTLSLAGGTLSSLLTDSSAETVPSAASWYRFLLPPGHSYAPTYTGTLTHSVKLL